MPSKDLLPDAWRCLEGRIDFVQQIGAEEWHASCLDPCCGGQVHSNGEWPDRLVLRTGVKPRAWCRRCGQVWFPDLFGDTRFSRPTSEQLLALQAEAQRREREKLAATRRALARLRREQRWVQWHVEMREVDRRRWLERGVPRAYQDYWRLGVRHGWRVGGGPQTAALSLPIPTLLGEVLNIKYRLLDEGVAAKLGRYRYEIPGSPLFWANTSRTLRSNETVLVVEGEIKAMVVFATLDQDCMVVGVPGTLTAQHVDLLEPAGEFIIVADPGSSEPMNKRGDTRISRMLDQLGAARCRVLESHEKIDDLILAEHLTRPKLLRLLARAR
ncbi:MAG: hypothetical protein ACYC5M_14805 [Anaerolineae bacterium]